MAPVEKQNPPQLAIPPRAGVDVLFQSVAGELRALAGEMMAGERRSHTLQPTALVNELYLRLAKSDAAAFNDSHHFFQIAAKTLQRILIEHARKVGRVKRGGRAGPRLSLDDVEASSSDEAAGLNPDEREGLERALVVLAADDERLARVVELRFFGGMTMEQIAHELGCSERAVYNDWRFARAKLRRAMVDLEAVEE